MAEDNDNNSAPETDGRDSEAYELEIERSAAKEMGQLDGSTQRRVHNKIEQIRTDPFLSGHEKLSGADDLYRVRVGDYRIVYQVTNNTKKVSITRIRHRREVYRNL